MKIYFPVYWLYWLLLILWRNWGKSFFKVIVSLKLNIKWERKEICHWLNIPVKAQEFGLGNSWPRKNSIYEITISTDHWFIKCQRAASLPTVTFLLPHNKNEMESGTLTPVKENKKRSWLWRGGVSLIDQGEHPLFLASEALCLCGMQAY